MLQGALSTALHLNFSAYTEIYCHKVRAPNLTSTAPRDDYPTPQATVNPDPGSLDTMLKGTLIAFLNGIRNPKTAEIQAGQQLRWCARHARSRKPREQLKWIGVRCRASAIRVLGY